MLKFKNRLFFYTKGLSLILFLIYMHINQWWIEPQLNWRSGGAACSASQAVEGKEKMLNCSCVCPVNLSCKLLHQSPRELQWSKSSLKSVVRSNKSPCNAQDEWILYGLLNCPYFTSSTHSCYFFFKPRQGQRLKDLSSTLCCLLSVARHRNSPHCSPFWSVFPSSFWALLSHSCSCCQNHLISIEYFGRSAAPHSVWPH